METPDILTLPSGLIIRPLEQRDNPQLTQLIIDVWAEFDDCVYFDDPGIPAGTSTANLQDGNSVDLSNIHPEQLSLFQRYQSLPGQPRDRGYWVVEDPSTQRLLGGGGFAALIGNDPNVCELQKLYFLPELRGRGVGGQVINLLLHQAAQAGYQEMYLESIKEMSGAVQLYQKSGFRHCPRKGTTGHWRCEIFMTRLLSEPIPALSLSETPKSVRSIALQPS